MTPSPSTSRPPMPLNYLAAALPGARLIGNPETPIRDVVYDSRQAGPGALFVALRGSDHDGHDYASAAVERGATALMVEVEQPFDVPQIVVEGSSRAALARVACVFHGHPSQQLTVIGITGTDGKTTTTAMLRSILTAAGHQTGTIGTVGVDIGNGTRHDLGHQTTPESIVVQGFLREMLDSGTTHVVIEATSHGLATHRLDGVRFVAGGVTNITHEHLEFHKTIDNYRRAKAVLLERVASEFGAVVLNNDDQGAMAIAAYADGATVVGYGLDRTDTDLSAKAIATERTGQSFAVVVGDTGDRQRVILPMPGRFNVANALCAIGLATSLGVSLDLACRALEDAEPVSGRMQPIDAGQAFAVIVDYAHTPESIRMILSMLREQYPEGRLIVVTGSAGERDVEKRPLQGAACAEIADVTIVTSEDPRHEDPEAINAQIVAGAVDAGAVPGETVHAIVDRREAIAKAFALAEPGDCVLLAGKGHETSIIWGREHVPWNEAAVAMDVLRDMARTS